MLRPTFTGLAWATTLCLLGCGGSSGGSAPAVTLTPNTVDFLVDGDATLASLQFVDRTFSPTECAVEEGTVPASGLRRILRFDTMVVNMGALPCVIGDPANPAPPLTSADLEYHDCHGHYHLLGYATYELKTSDGTLVGIGQKQSFCILDSVRVVQGYSSMGFDCSYQGLSPGWADIYPRGVTGQWVDVSGVPEGDYFLWLSVNPTGVLLEVDDQQPNAAVVPVHVPAPSAAVANLDDHGDVALEGTGMPYPAGFQATIQTAGDLDFFLIHVVSGNAYTLRTELLSLTDSKIRVFTSDGVALLHENDDVAPGTDLSSRIDFTATLTGTLAVEVSGPSSATGMYRIIVE